MQTEGDEEKEFIIPTRYKSEVSSRLSWPLGAAEITRYLIHVPQVKQIQLSFSPSYGLPQQGKWPPTFPIVEIRYSHPPLITGNSDWQLNVYPVPRNLRAKIREMLMASGFAAISKWLVENQNFSGGPSYLSFKGIWNSNSEELNFTSYDNILPETSPTNKK
jgi:hypothetical protein